MGVKEEGGSLTKEVMAGFVRQASSVSLRPHTQDLKLESRTSTLGGTLFVTCVRPDGAARARLGVLHGYGDHIGRYAEFMAWMARQGVACSGLDFRGHGRSAGRRGAVRRWDDYLDDLDAFLGWEAGSDEQEVSLPPTAAPAPGLASKRPGSAASRIPGPPLFLLGHSHGGLILAAAALRGRVSPPGCIFTAPYFRQKMVVPKAKEAFARALAPLAPDLPVPSGLKDEWMTRDPDQLADSRADSRILRIATPRWYFSARRMQTQVLAAADRFHFPCLMFMGDADEVADPSGAREFFDASGSLDKTYRELPGAFHELLRDTGREPIFAEILAWLLARTGIRPEPPPASPGAAHPDGSELPQS